MKKSESTDLALAESLRTLMMRMPFEKITIKDITDEAKVIRTTFYNHFQDKYDLLDWIYYDDYIVQSYQLIENNMLLEAFKLMIKNMEKDKEFLLKATHGNQESMHDVMFRSYKEAVLTAVNAIGVDLPSINPLFTDELVAEYYANNVTFVVLKWIDMDMKIPSDKVVELFQMMFVTSIEGFL